MTDEKIKVLPKHKPRPKKLSLREQLKAACEERDAYALYSQQCEAMAHKVYALTQHILKENPIILAVPGMKQVKAGVVTIQNTVGQVAQNFQNNLEAARALRGETELEIVEAPAEDDSQEKS